jgi:hypothetical protein
MYTNCALFLLLFRGLVINGLCPLTCLYIYIYKCIENDKTFIHEITSKRVSFTQLFATDFMDTEKLICVWLFEKFSAFYGI